MILLSSSTLGAYLERSCRDELFYQRSLEGGLIRAFRKASITRNEVQNLAETYHVDLLVVLARAAKMLDDPQTLHLLSLTASGDENPELGSLIVAQLKSSLEHLRSVIQAN